MSDRRFNGESGEIMNFDYQWKQSWEFKTEVSQPIGAYEQRRARWARPIRKYNIPLNNKTLANTHILRKFFYDHQGQYDSFLFYDPSSKNRWTIPTNSIVYGSTMDTAGTWTDVCYNSTLNKFIMVGTDLYTANSPDGVVWTSSTMPLKANYWTVTSNNPYSPAIVAVGGGTNRAARSLDGGVTWNYSSLPVIADWTSVACGRGIFVAISMGGNVARSTSGYYDWRSGSLSPNNSWTGIAYGDVGYYGTFVAVGLNKTNYSLDLGKAWTSSTVSTGAWTDVCYGSGTFVAVGGTNYNKIIKSTDGITWSSATLPASLTLRGLAYGDGKFVSLGYGTNKAYYSLDAGATWASSTLPVATNWNKVVYGGGKFVAISLRDLAAETTKVTAYSTDGITWVYEPTVVVKSYLPFKNVYPLDTAPTLGPSGNIRVWVSGTEKTEDITVDQEEGSITFTAFNPSSGQEIEVEYSYYVRVRFNSDIIDVAEQRHNLESMTIELKEVR